MDMGANVFDNPHFFAKYIELRDSPASHNELLEKPSMYSLLPDLHGLRVLDLGCGYGDFCGFAAASGALSVTGIDMSTRMLDLARQRNCAGHTEYICADIEQWTFPRGSFDLVFSSLTLHYVSDLDRLLGNVRSALVSDGRFLLSVEHPIMTAQEQGWELTAEGEKAAWRLTQYGMEGQRIVEWLGCRVRKFHRKTETYIHALDRCGFYLLAAKEPQPTAAVLEANAALAYEAMRPPYLVISTGVRTEPEGQQGKSSVRGKPRR